MKKHSFLFILLLFASFPAARAADWKPIDPADLALKTPRVDPAADAEALFWEEWIADSATNNEYPYTTYNHYIRMKIFTDRGVKRFGTVDIEYVGKKNISEVAARTIHPDGTIQEMGRDAVFSHIVEKSRHQKVHAVSFATPGVTVGSIIEYRWREWDSDALANYVPVYAYREFPVEHLTIHIKPLQSPYFPFTMRYQPFHVTVPPFKPDARGWYTSQLDNLAAFEPEEDAPPSSATCPWILIYYSEDRKENAEHFWKTEGKHFWEQNRDAIKVNGDVKNIAEEVTSGAKSPEEKLKLLDLYCQKKIKNLASEETSDIDRQHFKPNKNSVDTLSHGIGTTRDIRLAFNALAEAAGFEARPALLCDREMMIFDPGMMIPMLPRMDVAVKIDGKWRLYDVTTPYIEPGHLRWQEEGARVLITDGKDPEWIVADMTPSSASLRRHQGQIKIDEQGTMEGELRDTLTGHIAEEWRETYFRSSDADRKQRVAESITRRLPGAEITDLKFSDPADILHPVSISYHVKMPGYSTRTGKRLFVTPAVAELNEPARYTASARKYDIMFRYPWSEQDDISVRTPPGYDLDHADAPAPINFGNIGGYTVRITKFPDRLIYHRELDFGKDGTFYFTNKAYPALKQAFDAIHDRDTHMLTFKLQQTEAAIPAPAQ